MEGPTGPPPCRQFYKSRRARYLKLEFGLPLPQRAIERVLAAPAHSETTQSLEVLQQAASTRTAVSCSYYATGRDAEEKREIEPYGLETPRLPGEGR